MSQEAVSAETERGLHLPQVDALLLGPWTAKLEDLIHGAATQHFLRALLEVMEFAFKIDKGYRRNIEGFRGRYLLDTADGAVRCSIIFDGGRMDASDRAIDDWDVKITYKDAKALRSFLFSQDADVLDSILRNEVEVHGNLNYVYRFGFLARDLERRLLGGRSRGAAQG